MFKMVAAKTAGSVLGISLLCVVGTSGAYAADAYVATPIPNVPGGSGTVAYGVNDLAMVVGQSDNADGLLVAFVSDGLTSTELPLLPNGSNGLANSINNSNVIVGSCNNESGVSRAVKWESVDGVWTITDLGTLDSQNRGMGVATRINNLGQIVGYCSREGPASYRACVWGTDLSKTDLGTLNYAGNLAYSQALGINDVGQVTGFAYAVLQGPEHGFLFTPGSRGAEDITPQEQFGLAQWHSINMNNKIAGYVAGSSLTSGAFMPATYVQGSGEFVLLPLISGTADGYAYDLNDEGTVVGTNFLLAPVPDPNLFLAFVHEGGVTMNLNEITTGQSGLLTEARDISDGGYIAVTADLGFGPQAQLLTPAGTPGCTADFNGTDGVTADDIFAFLDAWFTQNGQTGRDLTADFNADEAVTADDIFAFLDAWFVQNGTCN